MLDSNSYFFQESSCNIDLLNRKRKCSHRYISSITNSMEQSPSWEANTYVFSQSRNSTPLSFYGTGMFITAFAWAHHLSLSWIRSILPWPHSNSWKVFLILSSHLRRGILSGLFPLSFPTKTLSARLLSPIRATWPAYLIFLDCITRIIYGEKYRSVSSSLCSFLHSPVTSSLKAQIFSSTPYSQTPLS